MCYVNYYFSWFAVQNVGGDVRNGVIGTGWKTWFTVTNPSNEPVNVVFGQESQDPSMNYGNLNLWVSRNELARVANVRP
jgi:hypothetical protein